MPDLACRTWPPRRRRLHLHPSIKVILQIVEQRTTKLLSYSLTNLLATTHHFVIAALTNAGRNAMLRVSAVILWVESVCMLPACTARLDVVGRTSQLFGDEAVSASRRKRPRKTSTTCGKIRYSFANESICSHIPLSHGCPLWVREL